VHERVDTSHFRFGLFHPMFKGCFAVRVSEAVVSGVENRTIQYQRMRVNDTLHSPHMSNFRGVSPPAALGVVASL
jgi:hypothetical protein